MERIGVWGGHKPDKPGVERIIEYEHPESDNCSVKRIVIYEEE